MHANVPTMLTAYCALVQYLQFSNCMGPEMLRFLALSFIWASSWAFGTIAYVSNHSLAGIFLPSQVNLHLPHHKKESDKPYTMKNLQL